MKADIFNSHITRVKALIEKQMVSHPIGHLGHGTAFKLAMRFAIAPFTNAPYKKVEVKNLSSGFWGRYKEVTENWMAFVDDTNIIF